MDAAGFTRVIEGCAYKFVPDGKTCGGYALFVHDGKTVKCHLMGRFTREQAFVILVRDMISFDRHGDLYPMLAKGMDDMLGADTVSDAIEYVRTHEWGLMTFEDYVKWLTTA